jgi:alpha-tubulin suppressor-like RCC1 family protein
MKHMTFFSWLRLLVPAAFLLLGCGAGPAESEPAESEVGVLQQQLCSNAGLVSDAPSYRATPGTVVNWTATASCALPNPEYSFWFQDTTGVWTNAQPYSSSNSYAWNTAGLANGNYNWSVWVREAGSSTPNNQWETYRGVPFQVNTSPACTGGVASGSPTGSTAPGVPVTWTASASSCTSTEYRFYLLPPGGSYALARDWSTSPTFVWDTTGATNGTWTASVWMRSVGSTATPETYATAYHTISASGPCSSASVTEPSGGSGVAGTTVNWTVSASPCSSAEYQYWILPPGGSYAIAQAWSTSPTFAWNTTGKAPGQYWLSVWVRSPGWSTSAYETYAAAPYNILGSAKCTGGAVVASPSSPSTLGTIVTVTASASTCSSPEYQFYYLPPGGTYSVVQPWSPNPNYVWNTSTASSGVSSFSVHMRQQGSTLYNETVGQMYYALNYTAAPPAGSSLASGIFHSCALRADATVNCWGHNNYGQIGNATLVDAATPVAVTGLSGATAVGAGYNHSCAVIAGGAVSCWGLGSSGQLGSGSTSDSLSPVAVSGLTGATSVVGGAAHTCARLSDGTARCWGYSSQGAIGNGSLGISTTPVTVTGLTGAVQLAAGYYHSCALLTDGTVKCWGGNGFGQLGNGTTTNSTSPVTVSGLKDVKALAASSSSTCALLYSGMVKCWGYNANGQLGNGSTTSSSTPVLVSGLTTATSIGSAPDDACAVLADGTAKCWGAGPFGELGNGSATSSSIPVTVAGLAGAVSIAPGWHHTCALLGDASGRCWGASVQGELGDGNKTSSFTPVVVAFP